MQAHFDPIESAVNTVAVNESVLPEGNYVLCEILELFYVVR